MATKNSKTTDTFLTKTSYLWDNSPKLQQVLNHILDPKRILFNPENNHYRETITKTWNNTLQEKKIVAQKKILLEWMEKEQVLKKVAPNVLDSFNPNNPNEFFYLLINHGRHWLNNKEKEFIIESWERRNTKIEQLKTQRNSANLSLAKLYEEKAENVLKQEKYQEAWLYNLAALNMEIGGNVLPESMGKLLLPEIRPSIVYDKGRIILDTAVISADNRNQLIAFGGSGFQIHIYDINQKAIINGLVIKFIRHSINGLEKNKLDIQSLLALPDDYSFDKDLSSLIFDIAFHPTKSILAFCVSCSEDKLYNHDSIDAEPLYEYLFIWNYARSAKPIIKNLRAKINQLTFNSTGSKLVLNLEGKTIAFLDSTNFQITQRIHNNEPIIKSFCLNETASVFIGYANGDVVNYHLVPQQREAIYKHDALVRSLLFVKTKNVLFSGGDDKKIKVWDHTKKELLHQWEAHFGPVTNLAINTNHTILCSTSGNMLRLWNWKNQKLLAQFTTLRKISTCYFNSTSDTIVLGTDDGKIQELRLNIQLFKEEESLHLEELLLIPGKIAHKKYLQNLYTQSLEVLSYEMQELNLVVNDPTLSLQALSDFFGIQKQSDNYQFNLANMDLFANKVAKKHGYPKMLAETIQLTPDQIPSMGSAVFLKPEILPPYFIEFEYQILNKGGGGWQGLPADGLTFLFLKDKTSYTIDVPDGGSKGFIADGKGYGIHFATFMKNSLYLTDGYSNLLSSSNQLPKPIYSDEEWRKVKIKITNQLVNVIYEDQEIINFDGNLDLSYRHIGFSAGTGGATAAHNIRNISIIKL